MPAQNINSEGVSALATALSRVWPPGGDVTKIRIERFHLREATAIAEELRKIGFCVARVPTSTRSPER